MTSGNYIKIQTSASIGKVSLEGSHAVHVRVVCDALHATRAEPSGCDRALRPAKPKILATWPFTDNVGRLLDWIHLSCKT